jgi:1-phosphatidylinositol phosphodiesterase
MIRLGLASYDLRMWRFLLALAVAACSGDPADPGWMASQPDTTSLAALSIPGTHDSAARFEPQAGLAKTQDLTIAEQLAAGVRYLDLRCRHVDDAFLLYHGAIDQNQTFEELVATVDAFLAAHPTEAIIASVKEEATPSGNTRGFDATFTSYLTDRWSTAAVVPALGDVRGKLVLLRRFATAMTPLGIDASAWPDNTTFSIANAASLRIQDAYMVTDNSAKWTAITALLTEARAATGATLFLDYTSGYQTMAALPNITVVADDINARLDTYLADPASAQAHLGVLVMDHVTAARARAIAASN